MEFEKEQIRHTLAAIFHAQDESVVAEMLDTARVEVVHSGSDFGMNYYSLNLRIPAARFGLLEGTLSKIERKIQDKLPKLGVGTESDVITAVNIYPEPVIGRGAIAVPVPTKTDERRIWKPNRIRLFLSHVSKIRVAASALKKALSSYGIDSFVAHEDIQPTLEWQREIEFALRSMHMLCAIVTEDFSKSLWTDQEVGFALGRSVPVVAIRCGADPYGLLGKHQALPGDLARLDAAAPLIANVVATQESLRPQLTEGLVGAVCQSISFQQAKDGMKLVNSLSNQFDDAQVIRLLEAVRDNDQVRDAHGVPAQIAKMARERGVSLPVQNAAEGNDFDDDIPF